MPNSCNCSTSLDYAHGIFAVCCSLEKLLLGEEMMRLEVDIYAPLNLEELKENQAVQFAAEVTDRFTALEAAQNEVTPEDLSPAGGGQRNDWIRQVAKKEMDI